MARPYALPPGALLLTLALLFTGPAHADNSLRRAWDAKARPTAAGAEHVPAAQLAPRLDLPPRPAAKTAAPNRRFRLIDLNAARQRAAWRVRTGTNGTPAFVDGMPPTPAPTAAAKTAATATAGTFFAAHSAFFRLDDPAAELLLLEQGTDASGHTHLCYRQQHQGLPLWGCDLVLHLDAAGRPYAFNGHYRPSPATPLPTQPSIDAATARTAAQRHLAGHVAFAPAPPRLAVDEAPPRLYYWAADNGDPLRLAWHVEVRPNWRSRWRVFVDATDGRILEAYDNTHTDGPTTALATGLEDTPHLINVFETEGFFFLIDASRPIFAPTQPDVLADPQGAIVTLDARERDLTRSTRLFHVTSEDNTWDDPVAVSAHANTGRVFDYYFNTHGRRGLDGRGGTMLSVVHVTREGRPMGNAFWNGVVMAYGDGDAAFAPLSGALDVAAHEMTHGVIERTVNLEYRFQSGALNESLADIFGAMVDRDDWRIGEDVVETRFFPSGALRDLEDPNNGGRPGDPFWQPAHMDEFVRLDLDQDNGGVHINSGIPNRAAFLLAAQIGREAAERLYYRVMDGRYVNSRANFADMRLAVARAAADLFGEDSPEVAAVHTAYEAVGITVEETAEAPVDIAPVEGEEWIALINAEPGDNSLYLARPQVDSDDDIVRLTSTQVRTRTGNPIAVADDGAFLLFVDVDNFIRFIRNDGSDERVISPTGEWGSIALSPDGRRLAATRAQADSTLFIFDLEDPDNSREVRLYNPTTQEGVEAFVTVSADAMTWDLAGRFLVYDALNRIPQASGPAIEFWNVSAYDTQSDRILPLFPAQPEGVSMGNPTFARTNDGFLAVDLVDFEADSSQIWAVNLFTGEANLVEANGSTIGYPRFAPDDGRLVFERETDGIPTLRQIRLGADRTRANAPSEPYLFEAQRPVWFAIGQRPEHPTAIAEAAPQPTTFALGQNRPNPFNSATQIRFSLSHPSQITLEIFSLQGQRIALLAAGAYTAGPHTLTWNGRDQNGRPAASGLYLYRLKTPHATQTRKLMLLK